MLRATSAARAALSLLLCCAPALAQQTSAAPRDPARFGDLPDFSFVDPDGAAVTRADLLGAPWIANLFFTSCAGPCPRLTADLRRLLHDELEGTPIRLVSLSVDPAYDTPERLRAYAASYTADPTRWLFLTGDEAAVHGFATGGLRLGVEPPDPNTEPAASDAARLAERMQVTHSTRLVVVDPEGRIAGYYDGGGEEAQLLGLDTEAGFRAALARARHLAGLPAQEGGRRSILPLVNATLNGVAFVFLLAGWVAIRRGRRELHAGLMRAAFCASAIFLACYLYYHFVVLPVSGGPTRYNGTGWRKGAYLILLASHVLLAIVNLPMVLRVLWLAHRQDWERHRRLARRTWPIWVYVSITGVIVYVVLYPLNPPPVG